jgi:hypothetical protein
MNEIIVTSTSDIKIVGGALTFGLLVIAFRRKFERKYTR